MTRVACAVLAILGVICVALSPAEQGPPLPNPLEVAVLLWCGAIALLAAMWGVVRGGRLSLLVLSALALPWALASIFVYSVNHEAMPMSIAVLSGEPIVALLVGTWAPAVRRSPSPRKVWSHHALVALMTLVAVASAGKVALAWRWHQWETAQPRAVTGAAPRGSVNVDIFSDYQCPICRARHGDYDRMIEQLSAEFPGRIVVRRIDFPLSTRCNENVAATIHPSACDAAILMRQARAVGRESEALALVYGQQEVLTPSLIAAFAAQLRLPFDGTDPAMLASIRADADFGHAVGVQGVPTYFVNGVQVYGWLPRQLEAVIRADLAEGAPSAIPAHK